MRTHTPEHHTRENDNTSTPREPDLWGFAQFPDGTLGNLSKTTRARTLEELRRATDEGGAVFLGRRETLHQIYRELRLAEFPADQEIADEALVELGEVNPEELRAHVGIGVDRVFAA